MQVSSMRIGKGSASAIRRKGQTCVLLPRRQGKYGHELSEPPIPFIAWHLDLDGLLHRSRGLHIPFDRSKATVMVPLFGSAYWMSNIL